jgi:hypothetical protein
VGLCGCCVCVCEILADSFVLVAGSTIVSDDEKGKEREKSDDIPITCVCVCVCEILAV